MWGVHCVGGEYVSGLHVGLVWVGVWIGVCCVRGWLCGSVSSMVECVLVVRLVCGRVWCVCQVGFMAWLGTGIGVGWVCVGFGFGCRIGVGFGVGVARGGV